MAEKMTTKSVAVKAKSPVDNNIVEVLGTEKSKRMKTGKSYKVSKTLADKLVKQGHATLKK